MIFLTLETQEGAGFHPGRSIGYPVKIWWVFPREGLSNLQLRIDQHFGIPKI